MDEDRALTDELEGLQSNISALFKSVIDDKNKYKQERNKSVASVESLMTEITILRKENEELRKSNNTSSCISCSELKEQLIEQDARSKKLEKSLGILREMLQCMPYKDGNFNVSELLTRKLEELSENQVDSRSKGHSLTGVDNVFSKTKDEDEIIVYDTFCDKTKSSNHTVGCASNREVSNSSKISSATQDEESYLDLIPSGADSKAKFELMDAEFRTPTKRDKSEVGFINSPSSAGNTINKGEKSPILVDQRLLVNRNVFPGSPTLLKRKASECLRVSPGKLSNKMFLKSPKQRKYKSPAKGLRVKSASQLKNSNYIEAEISAAGVRKLKQTQLNLDYYKNRSEVGGSTSRRKSQTNISDENKFGEDDLILESPKHSLNFYDEFKKGLQREEPEEKMENGGSRFQSEVFDPEETFVCSTFIRKSMKDTKKPDGEKQMSPQERSPEYNTVAYPYKGSPVRKKAERMRLPGQTCTECNKYYKAILGEIDPKKLQEILNQCSRHRDHHYNIVNTPPGYWKPYLTATMDASDGDYYDDDATHLDE